MSCGKLYGIGIGPGDPELITLKGARLLNACRHVFAPKARTASDSLALAIAGRHLGPQAQVHELVFPMTADRALLQSRWEESARRVAALLSTGEDACFLTLGDPLLYSTWIYLLRELRALLPAAKVLTIPGVTAFCAAAALAEFPVGEAKEPITIVPTADDLSAVRRAVAAGGTVVLMKIGRRLPEILRVLDETGTLDRSVLVARAGLDGQRIETDLRMLRATQSAAESEYLAVILVHAGGENIA